MVSFSLLMIFSRLLLGLGLPTGGFDELTELSNAEKEKMGQAFGDCCSSPKHYPTKSFN